MFRSVLNLSLCVGLCLPSLNATQAKPLTAVEKRASVSDFELKDLKGKLVRLSDYKGKVVLINFWATWCAPCKQELPHLNRIYKELNDQGFEVLAISTDSPQTISQVGRLARRWSFRTLLDPEGKVVAQLNPRGVAPYTLIVDPQGRVAFEHDGYTSGEEAEMEAAARALIAELKEAKTP